MVLGDRGVYSLLGFTLKKYFSVKAGAESHEKCVGGIPGTVPSLVSPLTRIIQEHWLIWHPEAPLCDTLTWRHMPSHEQRTLTFRFAVQPHRLAGLLAIWLFEILKGI